MPSDTDTLLRSLRQWLRAVVLLLSLGLLEFTAIGSATATNGVVFAVAGLVGVVVALVAGLKLLASFLVVSPDRGQETSPEATSE